MEKLVKRESFPQIITMEGFGSLYDDMLNNLKMQQLNEKKTNLDGTYVIYQLLKTNHFDHFCFFIKKDG